MDFDNFLLKDKHHIMEYLKEQMGRVLDTVNDYTSELDRRIELLPDVDDVIISSLRDEFLESENKFKEYIESEQQRILHLADFYCDDSEESYKLHCDIERYSDNCTDDFKNILPDILSKKRPQVEKPDYCPIENFDDFQEYLNKDKDEAIHNKILYSYIGTTIAKIADLDVRCELYKKFNNNVKFLLKTDLFTATRLVEFVLRDAKKLFEESESAE